MDFTIPIDPQLNKTSVQLPVDPIGSEKYIQISHS